mmetsp:Transcript_27738/g.80063  ORF Transcript_27738/g.80063 Transcript_27738/m.80063 type:complete len:283 (+) Transcript_27738:507-1355(+)
MIVRPALQGGEDGTVDGAHVLFLGKDHPRPRAAQRLVGGTGNDICTCKGTVGDTTGNQPRNVRHVDHQNRTHRIGNLSHPGIIPLPGVGRGTGNEELGQEHLGSLLQIIVIDQPRVGRHNVRHTLEVHRRGRNLALGRLESVRQMSSAGQVEAHDPVMRRQEGGVHGEVGGGAGVRLDVDAPFAGAEPIQGQGPVHAQRFDLVDVLVAAVVAPSHLALGVLVGEAGSQDGPDGRTGEIFRGDELEAVALPAVFGIDHGREFRVELLQEGRGAGWSCCCVRRD